MYKLLILLVGVSLLAACTILPRSGPSTQDVYRSSLNKIPIIPIHPELAAMTDLPNAYPWLSPIPKNYFNYDKLGIGDKMEISIWENASEGLYSGNKKGVAHLDPVLIGANGTIFIPYLGKVKAAGLSLEELQKKLTDLLKNKMMNPQVVINKVESLSKLVSIQGVVTKPGSFELKPGQHDLISLLAEAGGSSVPPELTEILLERQGRRYKTSLLDIFQTSAHNLDLYPQDHLILTEINRSFSVLGATGVQKLIKFPKCELSLIEALALAEGLDDDLANPSHVFLLRLEPDFIYQQLLAVDTGSAHGCCPVIYEMNMRKMESVFAAKLFKMRDNDLIITTNAPYTNVRKLLSSLSPAIALGRTSY